MKTLSEQSAPLFDDPMTGEPLVLEKPPKLLEDSGCIMIIGTNERTGSRWQFILKIVEVPPYPERLLRILNAPLDAPKDPQSP